MKAAANPIFSLLNRPVGRIAVGKILGGNVNVGDPVFIVRHEDGKRVRAKITKVFEFTGLGTRETESAVAGNIVGLSGFFPDQSCADKYLYNFYYNIC